MKLNKMFLLVGLVAGLVSQISGEVLSTELEHKMLYDADSKTRGSEFNAYLTLQLPLEGLSITGESENSRVDQNLGVFEGQTHVGLFYSVMEFLEIGAGPRVEGTNGDTGLEYEWTLSAFVTPSYEAGAFSASMVNEFNFLGETSFYYNDLVLGFGFEDLSLELEDENEYTYSDGEHELVNTITISKGLLDKNGYGIGVVAENGFEVVWNEDDSESLDIIKAGLALSYKSVEITGYYAPIVHPEVINTLGIDLVVSIEE